MIACLIVCAFLVTACGQYGTLGGVEVARESKMQPLLDNSGKPASRVYRLGVGDKLKVSVFGEKDLSGTFEINAFGLIAMPLIGDIKAQGHSIETLKRHLTQRLSNGYLKSPKLAVIVTNYRPFYVHGEVRQGGEFEYKSSLTFRDAIAKSGGYSYRANTSYVLVRHEGDTQEFRVDLPSARRVLPGDNIRVPERWF